MYHRRLDGYTIDLEHRKDLQLILDEGEPYLFDTDGTYVDTYHDVIDLPDGHSCLVAPLKLQGKPLGLLTFDHRACGRFTPSIVGFIGAISQLVAMVLTQTNRSATLESAYHALTEDRNRLLGNDGQALQGVVGDSTPWRKVLALVKLCATSDTPVLIRGETGTGKEGIARAIHALSTRTQGPFVAANCSALSQSLAESELFGHERGAFTGAQGMRRGRFELPDGDTLFLDEIGDLPLELQPKVLRAIQEGNFERLGGERTIKVNVRIITATHVNLEAAMGSASFRADL